MVSFSRTLNDPNPNFKVMPIVDDGYLRNGTRRDIVTMEY